MQRAFRTEFEKKIFETATRRPMKPWENSPFSLAERLIVEKDLLMRAGKVLKMSDEEMIKVSKYIDERIEPHFFYNKYGYGTIESINDLHKNEYAIMRKLSVDALRKFGYGKQVSDAKFWIEVVNQKFQFHEKIKNL